MPTYDYVCHHCGHRFEVVHGVHDEGPKTCPVCHSNQVRKAFAPPTIHYKGSGWAKKDRSATRRSGTEAKPAEAGATSGGGSDSAAGSGSSTASDSGSSSSSSSPGSKASGSSSGGAASD
jgi:putative FmdB family regulatory protein